MIHDLKTRKPFIPQWTRTAVLFILIGIVAWVVVIPQYSQAGGGLSSLENTSLGLVILAGLLEIGSLLAYSSLTAVVIGRIRPSYFTLLRIDLTNTGASHAIPGGGPTATTIRFHLLKKAGVPSNKALTAVSIEIISSNLILGLIFLLGIILSISSLAYNQYYAAAGIISAALVIVALILGWLLTQRTDFVLRMIMLPIKRFSDKNQVKAANYIKTMAKEVNLIRASPTRIAAIIVFGLLNWVLDAGALWVVLATLGYPLDLGSLFTAYGVASILSLLPITPGGIGIVEGVLVPSLVGFGVPGAVAVVAVIGWRVLQFWLPIPVGLISYVTLKFGILRK